MRPSKGWVYCIKPYRNYKRQLLIGKTEQLHYSLSDSDIESNILCSNVVLISWIPIKTLLRFEPNIETSQHFPPHLYKIVRHSSTGCVTELPIILIERLRASRGPIRSNLYLPVLLRIGRHFYVVSSDSLIVIRFILFKRISVERLVL